MIIKEGVQNYSLSLTITTKVKYFVMKTFLRKLRIINRRCTFTCFILIACQNIEEKESECQGHEATWNKKINRKNVQNINNIFANLFEYL